MKFFSHFWLVFIGIVLTSCTPVVDRTPSPVTEMDKEIQVTIPVDPALPVRSVLPPVFQLRVPFSPQAPHASWDDPYQEACEEMSALMVHWYKSDAYTDGDPTADEADEELRAMIATEESMGLPMDITLNELSTVIQKEYGYSATIIDDPSIHDIKRNIAAGNPVIVPAAGRELGNPYFSGEGPWYHMLVVTGYDRRYFTTNDPGTRRGKNYRYRHSALMNAIHDWHGKKENISNGASRVLILLED